jgi:hypothetical protein
LEGDILITEMDNSPFIAWYDQTFKDKSEEMRRRERPAIKKEVQRQKIVTIDDEKMLFDDRSRLDRVKL